MLTWNYTNYCDRPCISEHTPLRKKLSSSAAVPIGQLNLVVNQNFSQIPLSDEDEENGSGGGGSRKISVKSPVQQTLR